MKKSRTIPTKALKMVGELMLQEEIPLQQQSNGQQEPLIQYSANKVYSGHQNQQQNGANKNIQQNNFLKQVQRNFPLQISKLNSSQQPSGSFPLRQNYPVYDYYNECNSQQIDSPQEVQATQIFMKSSVRSNYNEPSFKEYLTQVHLNLMLRSILKIQDKENTKRDFQQISFEGGLQEYNKKQKEDGSQIKKEKVDYGTKSICRIKRMKGLRKQKIRFAMYSYLKKQEQLYKQNKNSLGYSQSWEGNCSMRRKRGYLYNTPTTKKKYIQNENRSKQRQSEEKNDQNSTTYASQQKVKSRVNHEVQNQNYIFYEQMMERQMGQKMEFVFNKLSLFNARGKISFMESMSFQDKEQLSSFITNIHIGYDRILNKGVNVTKLMIHQFKLLPCMQEDIGELQYEMKEKQQEIIYINFHRQKESQYVWGYICNQF